MCGGHFIHRVGSLLAEKSAEAERPAARARQAPVEMTTACPACHAFVPARYTWCPDCGAALKARSCAYCGQSLPRGDKACSNCGAPNR